MAILLTGASGTIGTALRQSLTAAGHTVISLVRRPPQNASEIQWDPTASQPIAAPITLPKVEAIINLCGLGIADHRWTELRKYQLHQSRIAPLEALGRIIPQLPQPPAVILSASGINAFGNAGDKILTDDSPLGTGFLAALCRDWESAALDLSSASTRVVPMRFGAVLTPTGGMLKKLLPLFRLGLGGPLGNGHQYLSWITLPDLLRAMQFVIATPEISGSLNAVAPNPITNAEFTHALAKKLHRPAILPAPAIALRLAFGQLADEALLASTRAIPHRLTEAGFQFHHPTIEAALTAIL